MKDVAELRARYETLRAAVTDAEQRYGRAPGSVHVLAVGKTMPASAIRALASLGQRDFGENYVQEAMKI